MTNDSQAPTADATSGFFINAGTHAGWFTTPEGDIYDIRKLEPREVTDPRNGEISTIWGGYATARDRDLAVKDTLLQADFKKSGMRPTALFAPESKDIPLYITLRHRPGKMNAETGRPAYTDIGSFWNAKGRYTIFARDLEGKRGLRFGGNVLAWKPAAASDTTFTNEATPEPDGAAARSHATARNRRNRDKAPSADA